MPPRGRRRGKRDRRWFWGEWPLSCGAWVLLGAAMAIAAPPEGADPNSPLAAWYHSLMTPDGRSCCSVADCRPAEARLTQDGWQIRDQDKWADVPPELVLKRDNQDGRPIACRSQHQLLCFVPPAGT